MGRKQSTFSFLLSDPFTGLGLDVHSLFFYRVRSYLRLLNYATLFHSHLERNGFKKNLLLLKRMNSKCPFPCYSKALKQAGEEEGAA